jgi:NAD-dependent DNA ligase
VDNSVQVCFEGRHVCPTGKFLYGSRSKVEAAIVERGGLLAANPTKKTDFLVVGSMASKDWAMTSYGRKIEYAMGLRAQGCPILVVGEEAFMAALTQPPLK